MAAIHDICYKIKVSKRFVLVWVREQIVGEGGKIQAISLT